MYTAQYVMLLSVLFELFFYYKSHKPLFSFYASFCLETIKKVDNLLFTSTNGTMMTFKDKSDAHYYFVNYNFYRYVHKLKLGRHINILYCLWIMFQFVSGYHFWTWGIQKRGRNYMRKQKSYYKNVCAPLLFLRED